MTDWLDAMEAEGALVPGLDRYSASVRGGGVDVAGHDQPLRRPHQSHRSHPGETTTKQGNLLRNSITVRTAGDEVEAEPGFFEVDTVAHCGPSLKGEFARSVNFTDMHTGGVFTHPIRNNQRRPGRPTTSAPSRPEPAKPDDLAGKS